MKKYSLNINYTTFSIKCQLNYKISGTFYISEIFSIFSKSVVFIALFCYNKVVKQGGIL